LEEIIRTLFNKFRTLFNKVANRTLLANYEKIEVEIETFYFTAKI